MLKAISFWTFSKLFPYMGLWPCRSCDLDHLTNFHFQVPLRLQKSTIGKYRKVTLMHSKRPKLYRLKMLMNNDNDEEQQGQPIL